jgi:hypothetical protein
MCRIPHDLEPMADFRGEGSAAVGGYLFALCGPPKGP